jgi:hypothetical protein
MDAMVLHADRRTRGNIVSRHTGWKGWRGTEDTPPVLICVEVANDSDRQAVQAARRL